MGPGDVMSETGGGGEGGRSGRYKTLSTALVYSCEITVVWYLNAV
jgi:hypothetical protein